MKTNFEPMSKPPMKPVYILGISCLYHDSAAALLCDGKLVAAAQEERFTRKKQDDSFPTQAVQYCLEQVGISIDEVSAVGFYDKPLLKFERILSSFVDTWPRGYVSYMEAIPMWLRNKLWIKNTIRKELKYTGKIYFAKHHLSHAASAFFVSPFDSAAIITLDGVGEWSTTSYGIGKENAVTLLKEIDYPDSLGMFYSVITHFLGFKPNSAEYKVMGLAPYGVNTYREQLERLITVFDDGSFLLSKKYFRNFYDLSSVEGKLEELFGFKKRDPGEPLEQCHKDLAASLQFLTNDIVVAIARHVQKETGMTNLCMAGGVALNCVANSEILKRTDFKKIFIQPAAGDAGGALGVAYCIWHMVMRKTERFEMTHAYWGPEYSDHAIKQFLDERELPYVIYEDDDALALAVAGLLDAGSVIGWLQGRMEWGPRSLGARSILADPRNKDNWQRVNLKIKFRESFRPFAPSVLLEYATEYFKFSEPSPYMLFVADVLKGNIPAVTHVDKTARLQTVSKEGNPLFHKLIQSFYDITGCPVVINTSFNVRGQPIVCTPFDAFNTFMETDMDHLVMGRYVLDKKVIPHKYDRPKPQIAQDAD
jgi:carbamoyltransferase